jgi:hypothetical protein
MMQIIDLLAAGSKAKSTHRTGFTNTASFEPGTYVRCNPKKLPDAVDGEFTTSTNVAKAVQFLASFWVKRADRPVPDLQKPTAELEATAVSRTALRCLSSPYPSRHSRKLAF